MSGCLIPPQYTLKVPLNMQSSRLTIVALMAQTAALTTLAFFLQQFSSRYVIAIARGNDKRL
jgi:hypothetical protein